MRSRTLVGALLVSALLLLTGCGVLGVKPSPVTTATTALGDVVTIDWVDFPGHAGMDAEPLLNYADQTELEPQARELVTGISDAIQAESGLQLGPVFPKDEWFGAENWHPQMGNGYGGESMLITVNCCEMQSEVAPDPARWQAVVDAASDATRAAGLGSFVIDEHSVECNGQEGCWLWAATATDGVQWVYLTIQDATRDPTGEAARDAEESGWPVSSLGFGYGATVVEAGGRDAFVRAMQPFIGQTRPPAMTSD